MAGVLLRVHDRRRSHFSTDDTIDVVPGRCFTVLLRGPLGTLQLCPVHLNPEGPMVARNRFCPVHRAL
eukprot:7064389-Pyramimonas_sp.AAC.1